MQPLFFIKLLIVLSIICIILLLILKINETFSNIETFNNGNNPRRKHVNKSIKLSIEEGKSKNSIFLNWTGITNLFVKQKDKYQFVIIFYKNNLGPYLIPLKKDYIENDTKKRFTYPFSVSMNSDYKFAIIQKIANTETTDIGKYVSVKLTPPGLDIKYIDDVRTKVVCKADGGFELINSKKCINSELPVIAKFKDDDGKNKSLGEGMNTHASGYDKHEQLMRELTYSPKLQLNFT